MSCHGRGGASKTPHSAPTLSLISPASLSSCVKERHSAYMSPFLLSFDFATLHAWSLVVLLRLPPLLTRLLTAAVCLTTPWDRSEPLARRCLAANLWFADGHRVAVSQLTAAKAIVARETRGHGPGEDALIRGADGHVATADGERMCRTRPAKLRHNGV